MLNPYEHLAYHLRQAIIGIGTNTKVINEILCSNKTNEELKQVKKAYESSNYIFINLQSNTFFSLLFVEYGARLERDIYEETAGTYRDFLLELLNGNRSTEVASRNRTAKIVKLLNLYKSSGNEELLSTINTVFATESYDQLREAFAEFILNKSESIQELFETLSDDHKNAFEVFCNVDYNFINIKNILSFLFLVETIYDEHKFYARRLYEAIDGIGTDDMTLMRIVVGRAEIDLGCISEVYNVMYDESLASAIMV